MRRGLSWVAVAVTALALSGCCGYWFPGEKAISRAVDNIQGGPVQRETHRVSLDSARLVDVVIEFAGGDLMIGQGDTDLMSGEFVYNLSDLQPVIEYEVQQERGSLRLRHESDTIHWGDLRTELRNEWRLQFTDRVPLKLAADVGASRGELELGGLRLQGLDLTAGVADITVSFSTPNPEELGTVSVHSGAAKLELLGLGNANLQELDFDGGLGTYTFDFVGDWQRSARARIQAGASRVVLRLPREIGVRVCPGDVSRGDYDGLRQQEECYVNPLYGDSGISLEISLDLGLGRLDIEQAS
jgi:hypothetical protein